MSHPVSKLDPSNSFSHQVKKALHTYGLLTTIVENETLLFDRVTITHNNNSLELFMIELNAWRLPTAIDFYNRCVTEIHRLRQQGKLAIILWEDQWIRSRNVVMSRIQALLGISARIPGRLTYVARIDKSKTDEFLSKNHLQGNVSSKYRYGLFLPVRYFRILKPEFPISNESEDLLVAVATFSNARIFQKDDKPFRSFEMIRFANLLETTVIGGMNKLMAAFINDFIPDDIMTYADLEWSDGAAYRTLGFEAVSDKPSIPFWVDEGTSDRYNRFDTSLALIQITNAGSRKYVKVIKPSPIH